MLHMSIILYNFAPNSHVTGDKKSTKHIIFYTININYK